MVKFKVLKERKDDKFEKKIEEYLNNGWQIVNCYFYKGYYFGFLKK